MTAFARADGFVRIPSDVEYLEEGIHSVEVGPGDFVVVPDRVPHNEIFEADAPAEAVVVRYGPGGGPTTIELADPTQS